MTIHNDLFPETLVVTMIDGKPMTSSLQIAEHFGKNHQHVLRTVRSLLIRTTDPVRLSNFGQSSYLNEQNKPQPMYLLTRMGFEFVVSSFTGAEAEEWKWQFLMAFHSMESQLHALTERKAAALYHFKPHWPTIELANAAGLTRRETCEITGHRSVSTIGRHLKQMRALHLVPMRQQA